MRLTLALVLAILFPSAAQAAAPGTESVAGALTRDECFDSQCISERFIVGAVDNDPLSPEGDSGFVRFDFGSQNPDVNAGFEGQVTCLNVLANTASLAGFITRSEGLPATFDENFHVQVVDGGHPAADLSPDSAIVAVHQAGAIDLVNCTVASTPAFFPTVSEHGNLVVRDDAE
jgi:hypothetical protein